MHYSYSRVDTFNQCPKKYWYRYLMGVTYPLDIDADNPLVLGTALHKGIEMWSPKAAVDEYRRHFPISLNQHIDEEIKLEIMVGKALDRLPKPEHGFHEVKMELDGFLGFADYVTINRDKETWTLWDFKYAKDSKFSRERYQTSAQLHIYAYFLRRMGCDVQDLRYLLVPKTPAKRKKGETTEQHRRRIRQLTQNVSVDVIDITYDEARVAQFFMDVDAMKSATEFPTNTSRLCDWCDYQRYCQEGEEMPLPKNVKRQIGAETRKKLWIYGAPFTGKTTFANTFPEPLMLNTDGNIKFVDAPALPIKDSVTKNGRATSRKLGWQVFVEAIDELETDTDSGYQTIIVDLLEDTYELCRQYVRAENGWEHESDDSFKAWDMVRGEFLKQLKRLTNLDYNIVLISHEDVSKDVTRRSGDKVTAVKPAIQDKVANKVSGMVDVVARALVMDNQYILSFKTDEVIFGGGRLNLTTDQIPMTYEDLEGLYEESAPDTPEAEPDAQAKKTTRRIQKAEPAPQLEEAMPKEASSEETDQKTEAPTRRRRSRRPRA